MSAAISQPPPPRTAPAPELDVLLEQQYASLGLQALRVAPLVSAPPAPLPEPLSQPHQPPQAQARQQQEEPVLRLAALLARERAGAANPAQPVRAAAREASQVALVELDAHLRVRNLNPAAARVLGVAQAAARGRPLVALLRPLQATALGPAFLAQLAEGEPIAQTLACTAHDGRAAVVEWICLPEIGCSGNLARVRVLLRDETARAAALEAVRRAAVAQP